MAKNEIKNKKTIRYLKEILDREVQIYNPTPLEIPGFGKVTATSMVNLYVNDGEAIPYFRFKNKKQSGEFTKEGKKYFVAYG